MGSATEAQRKQLIKVWYKMELFLNLSRHYEICVKEFEEKCVKKMILSERSESTHF